MNDVLLAISHLKAGKCDGNSEMYSNHFLYACNELALHISFLLSACWYMGLQQIIWLRVLLSLFQKAKIIVVQIQSIIDV